MRVLVLAACCGLAVAFSAVAQTADWRTWSAAQAESIGKSTYVRGQVGSRGTLRLLKAERAINYKLAATWMTPDVISASARVSQLRSDLTDEQTEALADEAREVGDTVVMIEIDPNEGSGVIPLDWEALLQPKGRPDRAVRGMKALQLRQVKALQGVMRRNYDYDRLWVTFSMRREDGQPLFEQTDAEAELIVRIYEREGRVTWRIPASIRERQQARTR